MKFRIHPAFWLYISLIALLSSPISGIAILLSLLTHEAGHYLAAWLINEPIDRVEITPFGGVMTYRASSGASKGVRGFLLAAAGPAANYLSILMASVPVIYRILGNTFIQEWITANAVMMILNLLPALPLDGGRILFSMGYYCFRISALTACLSFLGMMAGAMLLCLSIYGLIVYQLLNCSLALIGFYLLIIAHRSKTDIIAENLFAVVEERLSQSSSFRHLSIINVPMDTQLYRLLDPMIKTKASCFVYQDNAKIIHLIDEQTICRKLLNTPFASISQVEGMLLPCTEEYQE